MKNRPLKILIALLIVILLALAAYWYFFMRQGATLPGTTDTTGTGFNPFGRNPGNLGGNQGGTSQPVDNTPSPTDTSGAKIPALRLLSNTPVGGYGASTTGRVGGPVASSTTLIRWVDRGRGNIYEARGNTLDIATISNTVVPKIYESAWNKNVTAFVAQTISDTSQTSEGLYAELRARVLPKIATSTVSSSPTSSSTPAVVSPQTTSPTGVSLTPYELRGKPLPENVLAYATSPKKDRVFLLLEQDGKGVGYTMAFDGSASVQIFTTPLTQVNAEWPEEQTITITTKGAASENGYLYFVHPRTGIWKRILGPLPGLSTKVSTDAKHVFVSVAGNANNILTSIYNVAKSTGTDAIVRTLADKCIWGNFYKELIYCAVPAEQIPASYPDDWYKGFVSFTDKIWKQNALTGEIKLVSSIVDTSDRVIDAYNLGLDERDNFLIFMNRNDLSLWSLDLVESD